MKKSLVYLFVLGLLFASCSKDDDKNSNEFDGSSSSISDYVGQELLDTMIDMGLIIHRGSRPPNIEGSYMMSPAILENTNVETDVIGTVFNDQYFKFYEQNGLELMYSGYGGSQSDVGVGSFISGDGKLFSVFLILESDIQGYKADTIFVMSGKVTDDGFVDFQMAAFMKDNHGNPGGVFIENDRGRIFVDGDGLVDKIEDLPRMISPTKDMQELLSSK